MRAKLELPVSAVIVSPSGPVGAQRTACSLQAFDSSLCDQTALYRCEAEASSAFFFFFFRAEKTASSRSVTFATTV